LRLTAELYSGAANVWDRVRNPADALTRRATATSKIDAQARALLTPLSLARAQVRRFRLDEEDVLAGACGDIDGDGRDGLVLVSREKIALGHLRDGRFATERTVAWRDLASRAPVPLRQPLCAAVAEAGTILVGSTDYGGLALSTDLSKRDRLAGIPVWGGRPASCLLPQPSAGAFDGAPVDCVPSRDPKPTLAVPAPRFDAFAAADIVDARGGVRRLIAVREPSGRVKFKWGDEVSGIQGPLGGGPDGGRPGPRWRSRDRDDHRGWRRHRCSYDQERRRIARESASPADFGPRARARRMPSGRSWRPRARGRSGTRGVARPARARRDDAGLFAMKRRDLLIGAVGSAASAFGEHAARATIRTPYGGRVSLHVPWPLGRLDPHAIDDAMAACFGGALFDTLYDRDEKGSLKASLADGFPEQEGGALRVRVRPGLRFASGRALEPRAVAASIERARSRGASAWLAGIPPARVDAEGLLFAMRDSSALMRALASPMIAIVAPQFAPERPDGTGPFCAQEAPGGLRLTRNALASRGPSYLDGIDVLRAPDLVTSLRAFESSADDVGWLGSFLHEPRIGAEGFDAGPMAWAILRTGHEAGALDVPGMAQALADGVRYETLAPLVVGPRWDATPAQWTGTPCELLVRDDAPWLIELARTVAASSSPPHEVVPRPLAAAEIAQRRVARNYTLMVDVACPAGPDNLGMVIGLATANDPATATSLSLHPPRTFPSARVATRAMRVGVVGEIRLQGGRAPDVVLPLSSWGRGLAWGDAFRRPPGA
jgi:peptide/nickel transport system substrate-binding protein